MTDIDRELEQLIGERCATKDKDDFPDTDYNDPTNSRCPTCELWDAVDAYVKAHNLDLLDRIKEEIPEYWPNCENYPDSMSTYCNKCRWCKNRNRDDLVTGYEWANNDLKVKLDNIAKEIRGEG